MCGRFTMLTWDEAEQAARAVEAASPFHIEPDWPARRDAFPGAEAAVVVADDGGHMAIECAVPWAKLSIRTMTWGFSARQSIFNTRIETAGTSPMWRESFAERRCIVPAAAFFEPHRSEMALGADGRRIKQSYRFADTNGCALLLAGIWEGDRFSIMTCEPDETVSPVHDRMPIALSPAAARSWLFDAQGPNGTARIGRHGDGGLQSDPAPCHITLEAGPVYPAAPESGQLSLF